MKAGIARSGRTLLAAITAALMVLSVMAVYAVPAEGAENPEAECGGNDLWNGEYWKVQINNDGSFGTIEANPDDDSLITLNADGSWVNNHDNAVFRIVLKTGTPFPDFVHEPPVNPIDLTVQGLSHVTFCFTDQTPPPAPGVIIVEKEVTEGSDTTQLFGFTADYDADGFSLADGESNNSGDLDAGTYAVSETVPTGWTLDSATCDDGSDPSSIDLAAGETVTCTFVNDETPPPPPAPGVIIVEKEVTEGSDTTQSFGFTADYDADGFSLAHGESNNSGNLDAGTYAVSETVPTGWTLDSATCDDGSDPSSIDLAAGETVTCTFVNDETPPPPPPEVGQIIVVKQVPLGDTTLGFDFDASYDADGFSLAHGESNNSGDLAPGIYTVTEEVPSGWELTDASCDNGDNPSSIDLGAGDIVTCTFTNIGSEVGASIVITVAGSCELDGDEGQGVIDVEISVDGGADVVISESDGDVIETLSSSGTVTVPEGATYTWEATPNEGFEFPAGSDTSGSITIETCSDDPETLPFTGLDTGMMSLFASALLGGGLLLVNAMRRQEEA